MIETKNHGLIIKKFKKQDWKFKGLGEYIQCDSNWEKYLPIPEYQNRKFDKMACVSYSALNCIETLIKKIYNKDINFSDRYLAKVSGTSIYGNTFQNVAESIRKKYGLVTEDIYPDEGETWNEYYREIPEELYSKGKSFYNDWKVNWECVENNTENIKEALKYAPLQVSVCLNRIDNNGIYQITKTQPNHAVMLFAYKEGEYQLIFDHYEKNIKKLALDFKFGAALKYNIIQTNTMKFIKIKNKTSVYLIKNNEVFPINDAQDYLNLESDWSSVTEISENEFSSKYSLSNKKIYVFLR